MHDPHYVDVRRKDSIENGPGAEHDPANTVFFQPPDNRVKLMCLVEGKRTIDQFIHEIVS
jgi:hypothetical protein